MAKTRREAEEEEIMRRLPKATRVIEVELAPNQLLAAQLYAQGTYSKREIAQVCRMSIATFRTLRRKKLFKKEFRRKQRQYDEMDKAGRLRLQQDIVKPIALEIQKKIAEGDLGKYKMTTLMNFLVKLNNEQRLDTDGDVTSKVAHGSPDDFSLEAIQKRHRANKERDAKDRKISKAIKKSGEYLGIGTA